MTIWGVLLEGDVARALGARIRQLRLNLGLSQEALAERARMHRTFLPAYSPELNPAERVFEEVRRHIEGEVYPSLRAKRDAIDNLLRQLKADKPRLKRLIGWDWIHQELAQLPSA